VTSTKGGDKFPADWDERKALRVIDHYEKQTEEQALLEDEAEFSPPKPEHSKQFK
jgi:hypothetical protein